MNANVEALYGQIGQKLVDIVPNDDWEKIYLKAQVGEDVADIQEAKIVTIEGNEKELDIDGDTYLLLDEMRSEFVAAGEQPFDGITFVVSADGAFKVDFEYAESEKE